MDEGCHMLSISGYMLLFVFITASNSCMVDLIYDKCLIDFTFKVTEKSRLFACAAECVSYGICKSFNFALSSRTCFLNTGHQSIPSLQNELDYIYSEKDDWSNTPLGPCLSEQCGLSQRCTVKRKESEFCVEILESLAQGKPTKSSSVSGSSQSGNAVDGSYYTKWSLSPCFHVSSDDMDPWWQVDLQDPALIVEVDILGRSDCCPERLHDFAVEVFKTDPAIHPNAELQLCYLFIDTVTEPGATVWGYMHHTRDWALSEDPREKQTNS